MIPMESQQMMSPGVSGWRTTCHIINEKNRGTEKDFSIGRRKTFHQRHPAKEKGSYRTVVGYHWRPFQKRSFRWTTLFTIVFADRSIDRSFVHWTHSNSFWLFSIRATERIDRKILFGNNNIRMKNAIGLSSVLWGLAATGSWAWAPGSVSSLTTTTSSIRAPLAPRISKSRLYVAGNVEQEEDADTAQDQVYKSFESSVAKNWKNPIPYSDLTIGVLKETFPGENRVSQTPDSVQGLVKAGFHVVVEAGGESNWFGTAETPTCFFLPQPCSLSMFLFI